jgi:hypothetical protein
MSFTGLAYDTKYYSRVSSSLDTTWGPVRNFTTNNPLVYSYITSPANGATNVNYITNITAHEVPGASQYTIEANTQPDFSGTSVIMSGTSRTQSFTLDYNQQYWVRVQTDLLPGQWASVVRSFTTNSPLDFSYITSPADGSTNVKYVVNITSRTVPGATQYTIEANTQPDFSGVSLVRMGAGRTYSFTMAYDQTYWVRVQTNLLPGEWGPSRSFTTGNPVSLAYVTSPLDGAVGVPVTVNVTANSLAGATSYTIELNTSPAFAPETSIVRSGSGRTKNFSGLAEGTTYYSRVSTNLTPGQWGTTVRSFTTVTPGSRAGDEWMGEDAGDPVLSPAISVISSPNPFSDRFTFLVQCDEQVTFNYSLLDLVGNVLVNAKAETNTWVAVSGQWAQGVYLLQVPVGDRAEVVKMVRK